jgi:hypothetical protein
MVFCGSVNSRGSDAIAQRVRAAAQHWVPRCFVLETIFSPAVITRCREAASG